MDDDDDDDLLTADVLSVIDDVRRIGKDDGAECKSSPLFDKLERIYQEEKENLCGKIKSLQRKLLECEQSLDSQRSDRDSRYKMQLEKLEKENVQRLEEAARSYQDELAELKAEIERLEEAVEEQNLKKGLSGTYKISNKILGSSRDLTQADVELEDLRDFYERQYEDLQRVMEEQRLGYEQKLAEMSIRRAKKDRLSAMVATDSSSPRDFSFEEESSTSSAELQFPPEKTTCGTFDIEKDNSSERPNSPTPQKDSDNDNENDADDDNDNENDADDDKIIDDLYKQSANEEKSFLDKIKLKKELNEFKSARSDALGEGLDSDSDSDSDSEDNDDGDDILKRYEQSLREELSNEEEETDDEEEKQTSQTTEHSTVSTFTQQEGEIDQVDGKNCPINMAAEIVNVYLDKDEVAKINEISDDEGQPFSISLKGVCKKCLNLLEKQNLSGKISQLRDGHKQYECLEQELANMRESQEKDLHSVELAVKCEVMTRVSPEMGLELSQLATVITEKLAVENLHRLQELRDSLMKDHQMQLDKVYNEVTMELNGKVVCLEEELRLSKECHDTPSPISFASEEQLEMLTQQINDLRQQTRTETSARSQQLELLAEQLQLKLKHLAESKETMEARLHHLSTSRVALQEQLGEVVEENKLLQSKLVQCDQSKELMSKALLKYLDIEEAINLYLSVNSLPQLESSTGSHGLLTSKRSDASASISNGLFFGPEFELTVVSTGERVGDLVSELIKRLTELKDQLQQSEDANKELINALGTRNAELISKDEKLEQVWLEKQELQVELNKAEGLIAGMDVERQRMRSPVEKSESVAQRQAQLEELERQVVVLEERSESTRLSMQAQVDDLTQRLESALRKLAAKHEFVLEMTEEREEERNEFTANIASLTGRLQAVESEDGRSNRLRDQIAELESQLQEQIKHASELCLEMESLKDELVQSKEDRQELQTTIELLEQEVADLEQSRNKFHQQTLNDEQEISRLSRLISKRDSENEEEALERQDKSLVLDLQSRVVSLEEELKRLLTEKTILETELTNMKSVRKELMESEDKLRRETCELSEDREALQMKLRDNLAINAQLKNQLDLCKLGSRSPQGGGDSSMSMAKQLDSLQQEVLAAGKRTDELAGINFLLQQELEQKAAKIRDSTRLESETKERLLAALEEIDQLAKDRTARESIALPDISLSSQMQQLLDSKQEEIEAMGVELKMLKEEIKRGNASRKSDDETDAKIEQVLLELEKVRSELEAAQSTLEEMEQKLQSKQREVDMSHVAVEAANVQISLLKSQISEQHKIGSRFNQSAVSSEELRYWSRVEGIKPSRIPVSEGHFRERSASVDRVADSAERRRGDISFNLMDSLSPERIGSDLNASLAKQVDQLQLELSVVSAENQSLHLRVSELEDASDHASFLQESCQTKWEQLVSDENASREKFESLEEQIRQVEAEAESLQKLLDEFLIKNQEMEQLLNDERDRFSRLEELCLQQQEMIEEEVRKKEEFDTKITETKDRNIGLEDELRREEERCGDLNKSVSVSSRQREILEMFTISDELERKLVEEQEKAVELKQTLTLAGKQRESLMRDVREAMQDVEDTRKKLIEQKELLDEVTREEQKVREQLDRRQRDLALTKEDSRKGLTGEQEQKQELERELEAALMRREMSSTAAMGDGPNQMGRSVDSLTWAEGGSAQSDIQMEDLMFEDLETVGLKTLADKVYQKSLSVLACSNVHGTISHKQTHELVETYMQGPGPGGDEDRGSETRSQFSTSFLEDSVKHNFVHPELEADIDTLVKLVNVAGRHQDSEWLDNLLQTLSDLLANLHLSSMSKEIENEGSRNYFNILKDKFYNLLSTGGQKMDSGDDDAIDNDENDSGIRHELQAEICQLQAKIASREMEEKDMTGSLKNKILLLESEIKDLRRLLSERDAHLQHQMEMQLDHAQSQGHLEAQLISAREILADLLVTLEEERGRTGRLSGDLKKASMNNAELQLELANQKQVIMKLSSSSTSAYNSHLHQEDETSALPSWQSTLPSFPTEGSVDLSMVLAKAQLVQQELRSMQTRMSSLLVSHASSAGGLSINVEEQLRVDRLLHELHKFENSLSRLTPEPPGRSLPDDGGAKGKAAEKHRRLHLRCLRLESLRSNLVYQKKYLLKLLHGFQDTEHKVLTLLRRMISPSDQSWPIQMSTTAPVSARLRFKSVVSAVIAMHRMKILVRKWKNRSRSSAALKSEQKRFLPEPPEKLELTKAHSDDYIARLEKLQKNLRRVKPSSRFGQI